MQPFKNILASVDARADIHPALEWAVPLAERHKAKLKIIDVLPEFPWYANPTSSEQKKLLEQKHARLDALATPLRTQGLNVAVQVSAGKSSVEIIREVLRGDHDLVVRVAKGSGSRRRGFFGTTSFLLLRQCPCPAWIVKPDATPRFKHVLGAVDPGGDDDSNAELNARILEFTRSIAETENGRFSLLHAWKVFGDRALLAETTDKEMDQVLNQLRGSVENSFKKFLAAHSMSLQDENVHLINGEPAAAILQFAQTQKVDLIVMGTVARSGLTGLVMGNTAERILNWVECPVLALKPSTFVSPIRVE